MNLAVVFAMAESAQGQGYWIPPGSRQKKPSVVSTAPQFISSEESIRQKIAEYRKELENLENHRSGDTYKRTLQDQRMKTLSEKIVKLQQQLQMDPIARGLQNARKAITYDEKVLAGLERQRPSTGDYSVPNPADAEQERNTSIAALRASIDALTVYAFHLEEMSHQQEQRASLALEIAQAHTRYEGIVGAAEREHLARKTTLPPPPLEGRQQRVRGQKPSFKRRSFGTSGGSLRY